MIALVRINDFDFPEPSTYKGDVATIVDSARNLDGVAVGSVVRDNVGKVELSWKFLTVRQWSDILKLFSSEFGGKFYNDVTFFSATHGDWITRKMYVSDRNASMFRRDPKTGEILGWLDCTFNLIEV